MNEEQKKYTVTLWFDTGRKQDYEVWAEDADRAITEALGKDEWWFKNPTESYVGPNGWAVAES